MSRLTIDITDQQHQSLKALAALQGKTIKQYALERLFPADANGDLAWQELETLLEQRIADGLAGNVSTKSIAMIVDEELGEDRIKIYGLSSWFRSVHRLIPGEVGIVRYC